MLNVMRCSSIIFAILLASASVCFGQHRADSAAVKAAADTIRSSVSLKGVEVTAQTESHSALTDSYLVTKEMRRGIRTAGELLSRVNGVFYNPVSREIKYLGSSNVVILVDSIQKSESYIKRLSPDRFDRIDIVNNPTGKYLGYDAIINFHTKPNYIGTEVNMLSQAFIATDGRNGEGQDFQSERASFDVTYTRNRWNLSADGEYKWNQTGTSSYYTAVYPYNNLMQTKLEQPRKSPTDNTMSNRYDFGAALDFQPNDNHSFSIQWRIEPTDSKNRSAYRLMMENTKTGESSTVGYSLRNHVHNRLDNSFGLYYRGRFKGWSLNSSATYNFADWDRDYDIRRTDGYALTNDHRSSQRYFWGGADMTRQIAGGKMTLGLSDYVTVANYRNRNRISGQMLTDNSLLQNNLIAALQFFIGRSMAMTLTGGLYTYRNSEGGEHITRFAPRATVNWFWQPSQKFIARLNYSLKSEMPGLSLISDFGQYTDSLTYQMGNPLLKPMTNHLVSLTLTLWKSLNLTAYYFHGANSYANIAEVVTGEKPYILKKYQNATANEFRFIVNYKKSFAEYFEFSGEASMTWKKSSYSVYRKHRMAPGADWYLAYRNSRHSFNAFLSYELMGNMGVLPQMKGWGCTDGMAISLTKYLMKNRLSLMVMYFIPVHFAKGVIYNEVISPGMQQYTRSDNQFRGDNTFSLAVTYRFSNGKRVRNYTRRTVGLSEE